MKLVLSSMIMLVMFISCNETGNKTITSNNKMNKERALFQVNGNTIKRSDLPKKMQEMIYQNEFEAYNKNQNIFKEYALRIYLAKNAGKLKDGTNPPELNTLLPVPEPTEKELKDLFNKNKDRMPKGMTFESMRTQIAGYLKSQKMSGVFAEEVKKMTASGAYKPMIGAPTSLAINLDLTGHPQTGNKNARFKVIEVSDYTCGHCQRAHPAVKNLLKKYQDKISFTQVNYSLRPNGLSGSLVLGAFCAQKQSLDKFWIYHHNAFEETSKPHDHHAAGHSHAPQSPEENEKTILSVAEKSKLDIAAFKTCIKSEESKSFMLKTVKNLSDEGITGTPTFIVNNKKVMGGVAEIEAMINR